MGGLGTVEAFWVSVARQEFQFSAAHFVVFGNECELLHGHNYALHIELQGELNPTGYVCDFSIVKRFAKTLSSELDHRTLIPGDNPQLSVQVGASEVEVRFGPKRFVFPKEDVLVLPLKNCTVELLARYLTERLLEDLRETGVGVGTLTSVRVGVEESPGQAAWYERDIG